MAKTSPAQFMREVRQEARKISWPGRSEILMSGVMIFVLSAIAAVFFLMADSLIAQIIGFIL